MCVCMGVGVCVCMCVESGSHSVVQSGLEFTYNPDWPYIYGSDPPIPPGECWGYKCTAPCMANGCMYFFDTPPPPVHILPLVQVYPVLNTFYVDSFSKREEQ